MLEQRVILDLTKPLDEHLEIYREAHYCDPEMHINTWCTVENQGYWVSQLALGTQTGTHIDAPAHFAVCGATLEALPVDRLVGCYFLIDIRSPQQFLVTTQIERYRDEPILFLQADDCGSVISSDELDSLCQLPARVWVIAGAIRVLNEATLYAHQVIAAHGKYLVEELDIDAARQVKPGGEIIALPLRLQGVSGSPCRVIVLQQP